MEVTLNQIINQFLSLAPSSIGNTILEQASGRPIPSGFVLSRRGFSEWRLNWGSCQPGFEFISANDGSATPYLPRIQQYNVTNRQPMPEA